MFHIGQKVIYRPRHQKGFIFATVTAIPGKWVTIEFEVNGTRFLRSVKPDTLQPHPSKGPGYDCC